ncbi:MAG: FlgD immunoglobulin-like domain containing protein [Sulfurimonas sp.]|nr:FlgD immunoglobulin-like domain containing protein [Sulfurimonas sp.]MDD3059855.1 FlgD immunoglobulin-like domain containing protein [Sulfurimonas sp.]
MAITSTGLNAATNPEYTVASTQKDASILGKDDFLKLLLVELQHQDPTEPMDSEKILTQTSQLATLESADNTNKALEELAASLGASQQFSTVAAIGKTADLGSDAISLDEGSSSTFEVYFPSSIQNGTVEITDLDGKIVKTLDVGTNPSGVYQFTWDGTDSAGNKADSGIYRVNASYSDQDGNALKTRLGAYPIESVRFENGSTLVKVGSSYVPLENVVEIY